MNPKNSSTTLDIGCGSDPHGDVNVDLYPEDRRQCVAAYDPRSIPNFVLADACSLPFADGAFDVVRASHVLEHIPSPLTALKEWRRVCKSLGRVVVFVPSDFGSDDSDTHLYSWTPSTFRNLLQKVFPTVHSGYSNRFDAVKGNRLRWLKTPVWRVFKLLGFTSELYAVCCPSKTEIATEEVEKWRNDYLTRRIQ
jgi:SAM-dependent methyltransferase